jgi:hypothetical protein
MSTGIAAPVQTKVAVSCTT